MNTENGNEKSIVVAQVGQRIQKYRKQRNLTQDQVAERVGILQKHLSRIEQGYHNPRFDMIIQIADVLSIPTDALAKDLSEGSIYVFLENIKPSIERLDLRQREYVKESIELLTKLND